MFNGNDLYGPVSFGGCGCGGGGGWRADSCNTPRGLAAGGTIASAFGVSCDGSLNDEAQAALGVAGVALSLATGPLWATVAGVAISVRGLGFSGHLSENWDK